MLWLDIDFGFDFSGIFTFFNDTIQFLVSMVGRFIVFIRRLAFGALGILRTIWDRVFKRGLLKILDLVGKLRAFLSRVFGPMLRWLRKIRDWLDKVYYPRLLKVINMIQRVRQLLQVLRIFNVAWAKRLDERLLRLETKIAEPYLRLRALLNDVATIINLVLDPSLIFHRNVLLASILSHLGVVRRALGYGNARPLTSVEQVQAEREKDRYRAETVKAHVTALASSGLTDEDKARRADARAAMERVTGEALAF
jgi:hypothetical protein